MQDAKARTDISVLTGASNTLQDDVRRLRANKVDSIYMENGELYATANGKIIVGPVTGFVDNETKAILEDVVDSKVDGAFTENGYLYLTSNGVVVAGPLGPFSGGGGGGGGGGDTSNATITIRNTTDWLTTTVPQSASCPMSFTWSSLENEISTGPGSLRIMVNNTIKSVFNVPQGDNTIDLAPHLDLGTNKVVITVTDIYGSERSLRCTVIVVALELKSTFDTSTPYFGAIDVPYRPIGSVMKTMHFILDGTEIETFTTTISDRDMAITIPKQSHGMHTLRMYFDALINGQTVRSNELYFEIICVDAQNPTPVITCQLETPSVPQYTTIHILYSVYDPASMSTTVTISRNGTVVAEPTVERRIYDYNPRMDSVGTYTYEFACKGTTRTLQVEVTPAEIDIQPETENLALYLTSSGRSNVDANKAEWNYNDIECALTGFDYVSNGWVTDDDGYSVLRISNEARVTIPYKIFGKDFRTAGKTIEFEFATSSVSDYDSIVMSCLSNGRGFTATPQSATLTSQQSSIYVPFKEDEHIRLAFVVEPRSKNRLLYCYINGILSAVIQYPDNDDFSQPSAVDISLGNGKCTLDIYNIRVYDTALSSDDIVKNWIADTQDTGLMLDRFNRNNVMEDKRIVIDKLPRDLPYLIFETPQLPQFKGDKKKNVSGEYVDPTDPDACFTFTGAEMDVQGTSSAGYKRKNYKVKYNGGFLNRFGETVSKWKIRDNSIPVKTFCYKADVASSEGANNVELARLYNDTCPYETPAQEKNGNVRQGIDGIPIVIFHRNPNTKTVTFIGKYNWNNDKSTSDVFGFVSGDESWEVRNNGTDLVHFKTADYSGTNWLTDFEARYPDTDPPYTDPTQLAEFAAWIVSTDPDTATNEPLASPVTYSWLEEPAEGITVTVTKTFNNDTAEYRIAKFRDEAPDYMELDSAIYYYLFTEIFLMVDSRAKNMFPSFMGSPIVEPSSDDSTEEPNSEENP